jgi:acetyltransferase-like isoleucine patch superfamily enzyme
MREQLEDILNEVDLSSEELQLLLTLQNLHQKLRARTLKKYKRINPFYEDLFSWKERGSFWLNERKNVTIYNSTTLSGHVEVGDNTWIGPFCSLDGGKAGLRIGSYCSISAACHILTHDTVKWALSLGKEPYEYKATSLGDGCFVGTSSVILKGVSLGNQCLVAAGSVVTKSFPEKSIVGGVPAKKIGMVIQSGDGSIELRFEKK